MIMEKKIQKHFLGYMILENSYCCQQTQPKSICLIQKEKLLQNEKQNLIII